MKHTKNPDADGGSHHRSTSRYSINRLPRDKSPLQPTNKLTKNNSTFLDLRVNKENEDIVNVRSHHMSQFGYRGDMSNRRDDVGLIEHEEVIIDMNKRFTNQMNEKDMAVLQLKNNLKKTEISVKQKQKIITELQKDLQTKERLVQTLTIQNQSLNSALELLKSQSNQLTASHQNILTECTSLKKQLSSKASQNRKLQEQLIKANKDLQIYNSLEPRLKELEQLQDRLIEENQRAKDDRQLFVTTLQNIQKLVRSMPERSAECRQIETLINGYQDLLN